MPIGDWLEGEKMKNSFKIECVTAALSEKNFTSKIWKFFYHPRWPTFQYPGVVNLSYLPDTYLIYLFMPLILFFI